MSKVSNWMNDLEPYSQADGVLHYEPTITSKIYNTCTCIETKSSEKSKEIHFSDFLISKN